MGSHQTVTGRGRLYSSGANDGSSAANAAPSALWIKQNTGTTTDGLYWIKPGAAAARQVWCDMNTSGGGWMLVARTHPSAAPAAGNWGWRNATVFGDATTYTNGYCLDFLNVYNDGFRFSDYIYGNQLANNSNAWGPFIYQVSIADPVTFMTSDTQQSPMYVNTLKSDTNVYGTTAYPGMQSAIGFPVTGTANNHFYMRDCCGYDVYGIMPNGMLTTYCSSTGQPYYAGPFCNGSTVSGNTYVSGGSNTPGNTGGTSQVMLMVR